MDTIENLMKKSCNEPPPPVYKRGRTRKIPAKAESGLWGFIAIDERLKFLLQAKGWGVREFAQAVKIPEPTVRLWLRGRPPKVNSPVWRAMERYEKELGIVIPNYSALKGPVV